MAIGTRAGSVAPRFLLLHEVAEISRAPISTVRHWITTGKLNSTKRGRRRLVERCELARFLGVPSTESA
jgi:excisionase family DNA binding protein